MHTDRHAGQRVFRVERFLVFPDAFRGQVFFEESTALLVLTRLRQSWSVLPVSYTHLTLPTSDLV